MSSLPVIGSFGYRTTSVSGCGNQAPSGNQSQSLKSEPVEFKNINLNKKYTPNSNKQQFVALNPLIKPHSKKTKKLIESLRSSLIIYSNKIKDKNMSSTSNIYNINNNSINKAQVAENEIVEEDKCLKFKDENSSNTNTFSFSNSSLNTNNNDEVVIDLTLDDDDNDSNHFNKKRSNDDTDILIPNNQNNKRSKTEVSYNTLDDRKRTLEQNGLPKDIVYFESLIKNKDFNKSESNKKVKLTGTNHLNKKTTINIVNEKNNKDDSQNKDIIKKRYFTSNNVPDSAFKKDDHDSTLTSSSLKTKTEEFKLSEEQKYVLDFVLNERKSIFFTGSAGTGKSVLLSELIKFLKRKYRNNSVAVTASTGIAACNIGGCTLHSFIGCGYADGPVEQLLKHIKRNPRVVSRWRDTKVLIIDEISMIDGILLDKLEEIARNIRNNRSPFGGIQLVLCGDFLQLPPVRQGSLFAFNSKTWDKCIKNTFVLSEVFRQKEQGLINLLNDIRFGKVSDQTNNLLRRLARNALVPDGIEPTHLYPLRRQVESENKTRLSQLKGDAVVFHAHDSGSEINRAKLKDILAPDVLELKLNAQVILLKNLSTVLVNGSIGKVIDFIKLDSHSEALPLVKFSSKRYGTVEVVVEREIFNVEMPGIGVVASRSQVPLSLAYALSIHKSQGQTIEYVKVDLGRVFEKGQAYVALSRATSMEGLQVINYKPDKIMAHEEVIQFMEKHKDSKIPLLINNI